MKICIKLRSEESVWNTYINKLSEVADVEVVYGTSIIKDSPDVDALITTNLSETDIERLPNLKKVFLYKTGMDGLPIKLLQERNVEVYPSYANADVIAEHAIALTFSMLHRVSEFDHDLRNNIWYADGKNYFWTSISDLKIGILGYGHIGKCLYKKITPFTSKIKVLNQSGRYEPGIDHAKNLNQLIEWCDLLLICIPKNSKTENMIDATQILNMRGKYIVNISRAEICEENALYNALKDGTLKGYASDVWYCAPDKDDRTQLAEAANCAFKNLQNVVMSPHSATHEVNAHERYINDAVNQCLRFVKGELKI